MKYRIIKEAPFLRYGVELFKIVALEDIPEHGVKKYQNGGWIGESAQLSQEGSCWIEENAYVYGTSVIEDDALVGENCEVVDSTIAGKAILQNGARVTEHSLVAGNALVSDFSRVENSAVIDNARVINNSCIWGRAGSAFGPKISEDAEIELSYIAGRSYIYGTTRVYHATLFDVNIHGNSEVEEITLHGAGDIFIDVSFTRTWPKSQR